MEEQSESPTETLSREFFLAAHSTTSTHEEWLLRLCSQLMHREAFVISVMEENARQNRHPPPRWRTSSRASHASNSASTATGHATSGAS